MEVFVRSEETKLVTVWTAECAVIPSWLFCARAELVVFTYMILLSVKLQLQRIQTLEMRAKPYEELIFDISNVYFTKVNILKFNLLQKR